MLGSKTFTGPQSNTLLNYKGGMVLSTDRADGCHLNLVATISIASNETA